MTEFFLDSVRNILIYPGQHPTILQAIPEAKLLNGGSWTAVPRTLRNSQVLRWYNFPVAEIMDDYDWPIEPGKTPLPHQKTTSNFVAVNPRTFVLSDPGTMKTLSALWASDWLMRQFPVGTFRALIIAPLTILETVWASGIFRNFLGRRSFEILHGSHEKRRQLLAKPVDYYIINFDGVGVGAHTRNQFVLDGFSKDLAARDDIKLVIIDEVREGYGDARSKRNRIARMMFGPRQKPYVWAMTGTPTPNKPTDAYGPAKLLNNAFGKSFETFRKESMIRLTQFKWVPQPDGYDKARALLSPAIRFDITQVWNGPDMTTQQRLIEATPEQKKLLADLKRNLQITMKTGQAITAVNEAAARTKFLQISMGAVYDANHRVHLVDSSSRVKELESVILSTQRKVLIFVPLTGVLDFLYGVLRKKWNGSFINGNVRPGLRPDIIREFETNPDKKFMLLDAGAAGHGINEFVVADTVIWYGPVEKGDHYTQGNARAHRPGQKYPVTVFQFISTPLEKELFRRLENKESLQGALLDVIAKGEL